jgi:hypothetical protein
MLFRCSAANYQPPTSHFPQKPLVHIRLKKKNGVKARCSFAVFAVLDGAKTANASYASERVQRLVAMQDPYFVDTIMLAIRTMRFCQKYEYGNP